MVFGERVVGGPMKGEHLISDSQETPGLLEEVKKRNPAVLILILMSLW